MLGCIGPGRVTEVSFEKLAIDYSMQATIPPSLRLLVVLAGEGQPVLYIVLGQDGLLPELPEVDVLLAQCVLDAPN